MTKQGVVLLPIYLGTVGKIEVKEEDYSISLDSRIYSVDKKSILLIKKSDFSINTIEFAEDNFFKKLRERLFWGQDMRNSKTIK